MTSHSYKVEITAPRAITLFCDSFPLAYFTYRGGWRTIPNTSSGRPSRIPHPTLSAAGKRFSKKARAALREFESTNADALKVFGETK